MLFYCMLQKLVFALQHFVKEKQMSNQAFYKLHLKTSPFVVSRIWAIAVLWASPQCDITAAPRTQYCFFKGITFRTSSKAGFVYFGTDRRCFIVRQFRNNLSNSFRRHLRSEFFTLAAGTRPTCVLRLRTFRHEPL